jgi:hypothetical protein
MHTSRPRYYRSQRQHPAHLPIHVLLLLSFPAFLRCNDLQRILRRRSSRSHLRRRKSGIRSRWAQAQRRGVATKYQGTGLCQCGTCLRLIMLTPLTFLIQTVYMHDLRTSQLFILSVSYSDRSPFSLIIDKVLALHFSPFIARHNRILPECGI